MGYFLPYLQQVGIEDKLFKNYVFDAMNATNISPYFEYYDIMEVISINNPVSKMLGMNIWDRGEVKLVFHCTSYENAKKIAYLGFDKSRCHPSNRFGRGFYFARHSSKANNYAFGIEKGCLKHGSRHCTYCPRTMLLCHVAMGSVFYPQRFGEPPRRFLYDSAHAIPLFVSGLNGEEIVVYDKDRIMPYAIVIYKISNI